MTNDRRIQNNLGDSDSALNGAHVAQRLNDHGVGAGIVHARDSSMG
jgi:hypothetical protein